MSDTHQRNTYLTRLTHPDTWKRPSLGASGRGCCAGAPLLDSSSPNHSPPLPLPASRDDKGRGWSSVALCWRGEQPGVRRGRSGALYDRAGSETRSIGGMHRRTTTWPIGQTWSCSLKLMSRSRRGKRGDEAEVGVEGDSSRRADDSSRVLFLVRFKEQHVPLCLSQSPS